MSKKFIIFSDFDGTITNTDILDMIITNVYSYEKYKVAELNLLNGKLKYENYLFDMFSNIQYDISNISDKYIDENFNEFYKYISDCGIEFYIVSSGFKKIINHLLPYVQDSIIYANDINYDNGNWQVKLHDEQNNCSIDKNNIIKSHSKDGYKNIFIGDGLSDFKVMGKVHYLFCKTNSLLHEKCKNENSPHIIFDDFAHLLVQLKKLIY